MPINVVRLDRIYRLILRFIYRRVGRWIFILCGRVLMHAWCYNSNRHFIGCYQQRRHFVEAMTIFMCRSHDVRRVRDGIDKGICLVFRFEIFLTFFGWLFCLYCNLWWECDYWNSCVLTNCVWLGIANEFFFCRRFT